MKTLEQVKPMRNELNDASHTPGPWHLGQISKASQWIGIGNGACHVAKVAITPCVLANEARANAALISAAPELLSALESILNCPDLNTDSLEPATLDAINAAGTAIAKAKGEVYTPVF